MRYRHFKGGLYDVLHEATLEADLTPVIVYRSQDGQVWVRPRDVFFEDVDDGKGGHVPRFAPVD
jgi:hypothetical protein